MYPSRPGARIPGARAQPRLEWNDRARWRRFYDKRRKSAGETATANRRIAEHSPYSANRAYPIAGHALGAPRRRRGAREARILGPRRARNYRQLQADASAGPIKSGFRVHAWHTRERRDTAGISRATPSAEKRTSTAAYRRVVSNRAMPRRNSRADFLPAEIHVSAA